MIQFGKIRDKIIYVKTIDIIYMSKLEYEFQTRTVSLITDPLQK